LNAPPDTKSDCEGDDLTARGAPRALGVTHTCARVDGCQRQDRPAL